MGNNRSRSRAVRSRMAETGETYTQALRAMDSEHTPAKEHLQTLINEEMRSHFAPRKIQVSTLIQILATADRAEAALFEYHRKKLEELGHRLVDGGQIDGNTWEITDFRTRQVIAKGDGGYEELTQVSERQGADEAWFHVDHVLEDNMPDEFDLTVEKLVQSAGLPRGFVETVAEWVSTASRAELNTVTDMEYVEHSISLREMK